MRRSIIWPGTGDRGPLPGFAGEAALLFDLRGDVPVRQGGRSAFDGEGRQILLHHRDVRVGDLRRRLDVALARLLGEEAKRIEGRKVG